MKDTKIGNNTLTEFTLFPKLAVELQDEIWKHVARLQPRIVALEWYETADEKWHSKDADTGPRTETITIRQINRKTRTETITVHGYVEVLRPSCSHTCKSFVVNPEMDLIYVVWPTKFRDCAGGLGCGYCWDNRFDAVTKVLHDSGIIPRIKCLAVGAHESDHLAALEEHVNFFSNFASLELVLVVCESVIRRCAPNEKENHFFEHVHQQPTNADIFKNIMAGGPNQMAPLVVFVRQVLIRRPRTLSEILKAPFSKMMDGIGNNFSRT
jgi:hypothetical protein